MNCFKIYGIIILFACVSFPACSQSQHGDDLYDVTIDTIFRQQGTLFLHARTTVWGEEGKMRALMTTSPYGFRTHSFGGLHVLRMDSMTDKWSIPEKIPSLGVAKRNDSFLTVMGDVTPAWNAATRTVLCTGKTFFFLVGDTAASSKRLDVEGMQEIAYAVYDPSANNWSAQKSVALPPTLENGDAFVGANAGCTQRVDLPDGTVLLPIRYVKNKRYITTVIRCRYDGNTLRYTRHGNLFSIPAGRGLYEPSLAFYQGKYFLTLRADNSAYVTWGKDGLHFEPIREWKYDDGQVLGSYNTQQHWITSSRGLFLVYTRKGAGNDHIFRHRAPLFIARVDPEKMCIIRKTEHVLMPIPADGGDQGNFGVTIISPTESWVTVAVHPSQQNVFSASREARIEIAKIHWK